MNSKSKHHPYMLIAKLALLGLILQHIVGKSYIRHMPSSADWLFGNLVIDCLLRPSFILLLIAAGVMAKNEYQKGLDSFYRKMIAGILYFGVPLAIYVFTYGRYDTRPFDFKTAGILETAGYSLYWVPLLITYWLITPFLMWVSSQRYGKRVLMAYMCCWAAFVVIIPSVYFGRLLLHSIFHGSTEGLNVFLENLNSGFCKRVLNVVNESLGCKLSGFFVIGLLYMDNWMNNWHEVIRSYKSYLESQKSPTPTPCGGTPFEEEGRNSTSLKPPSTKEVDAVGGRRLGFCPAESDTKQLLKNSAVLKVRINKFVLAALYAMTLYIPFAEQKLQMDPYDHGLRDYILLHITLLGTLIYLNLASSDKIKDWSERLTRHSKLRDCVVVGMYVIHAALIEMLAGWIPPVPILGLLVKTFVLLLLSASFGGVLYYIFYGENKLFSCVLHGEN